MVAGLFVVLLSCVVVWQAKFFVVGMLVGGMVLASLVVNPVWIDYRFVGICCQGVMTFTYFVCLTRPF